jgi:antitoxin MazE
MDIQVGFEGGRFFMATTNIVKWGNSQGIRLPKHLLDSVNLSDNDIVEIIAENDSSIIKKANPKRHRTLKERLAGFDETYVFADWNTGAPIGREIFWEPGGSDDI